MDKRKAIFMKDKTIINTLSQGFTQRTDLALEMREMVCGDASPDLDGIESNKEKRNGIIIDTIKVTSDEGAKKLGKPIGTYITIDIGQIWQYSEDKFLSVCDICAEYLSGLIPKKASCLLAALGNRAITADSQGPLCAESFIVTRHIKEYSAELFRELGLCETACIVPDVLGNTGVEAANIVKGVAQKIKPDFIIAVDSLASRKTSRLATTLQMSDTGIAPGSGVGNHRMALNQETLGIPVIAIGIPTVVDAATVGADVLDEYLREQGEELTEKVRSHILEAVLKNGSFNYFVTPKNADAISKSAARLIALSVNKALNPDLSYGDMTELCCK